jgi:hypothetical protein
MRIVLVDVHVPAEDEDRVVLLERLRRRGLGDDRPFLELVPFVPHDVAEQLGAGLQLVHDREDPHQKSVAAVVAGSIAPVASTPASSSSPRST